MKRVLLCCLIMLFPPLSRIHAQQRAVVSPTEPTPRDRITISYTPQPQDSAGSRVQEVRVETLVFRANAMPRLVEETMSLSDGHFAATLAPPDSDAQLLLLRFVPGNQTDDDPGRIFHVIMYGTDGKPVQGAHLRMASLLLTAGFLDFKLSRDLSGAKAEITSELKYYPESWQARAMLWDLAFRMEPGESTTAFVRKELEEVFSKQRRNEEAVASLVQFFDRTGETSRGEAIRSEAVLANPKGIIAEQKRREAVFAEKDPVVRAGLLEKFLLDFPQHPTSLEGYERQLAGLYIQARDFNRLNRLLDSAIPSSELYYEMAHTLVGMEGKIEQAVDLAAKAVGLLRVSDSSARPSYMSRKRWEETRREKFGRALDLYASGLNSTGRASEAEHILDEAYETTLGRNAEINEHLVAALLRDGRRGKAMDVCSDCVRAGATTDTLLEYFKRTYVLEKGSERGFLDTLNNLKEIARETRARKLLKERLAIPAQDFILREPGGKRVKLSGLKGKVVVIDFWATWCEPCKDSFPFLQQLCEKYRTNERVRFLAVDTQERVSGAERELLVQQFTEANKYSFQVLLDEGYARESGVEGLPTRFVIDKSGILRFKSVGFGGGAPMMEELAEQIEILLNEP